MLDLPAGLGMNSQYPSLMASRDLFAWTPVVLLSAFIHHKSILAATTHIHAGMYPPLSDAIEGVFSADANWINRNSHTSTSPQLLSM